MSFDAPKFLPPVSGELLTPVLDVGGEVQFLSVSISNSATVQYSAQLRTWLYEASTAHHSGLLPEPLIVRQPVQQQFEERLQDPLVRLVVASSPFSGPLARGPSPASDSIAHPAPPRGDTTQATGGPSTNQDQVSVKGGSRL
jgi:hypothetical protein